MSLPELTANGNGQALAKPANGYRSPIEIAKHYVHDCGFSVIPIRVDGTKKPRGKWKDFQAAKPTDSQLTKWFPSTRCAGFAVVCGEVSGGRVGAAHVVVDFDEPRLAEQFKLKLEAETPGLWSKLTIVQTPRGDTYHLHTRYDLGGLPAIKNIDLAYGPKDLETGESKKRVETKGEGGYVLLPKSDGSCHPTGGQYRHVGGPDFDRMVELTRNEAELLLKVGRSFDQRPATETVIDALFTSTVTSDSSSALLPEDVLVGRCQAYLKKLPDAVSGSGGQNRTFKAACVIARFGLEGDAAEELLEEYNAEKCLPEWEPHDLARKLKDANKRVKADGQFGSMGRESESYQPGSFDPVDEPVTDAESSPEPNKKSKPRDRERMSVAVELIHRLRESFEFFHDGDQIYVVITERGVRQTLRLGDRAFRQRIAAMYFGWRGRTANLSAIAEATAVIEGSRAAMPFHESPLRVGGTTDQVYLDLGDDTWRAVEIDAAGWRIVDQPPVYFHRGDNMLALPKPAQTDLDLVQEVKRFCNVNDANAVVLVAWLLTTLLPNGPYPILVLQGEQGSAKSTNARILRNLVDPHAMPLRLPPKEERDLMIAARGQHILGYDNISSVPGWLGDACCCVATGGGFAARKLYEDDTELCVRAKRPQLFTGISFLGARPDFLDRAYIVELEPIESRRTEADIHREFEAVRPQLIGALLTMVAAAIRDRGETASRHSLPRMADAAGWALGGVGEPYRGDLIAAWQTAATRSRESALEGWSLWPVLRTLLEDRVQLALSPADLFEALNQRASDRDRRGQCWPQSAEALGVQLRRYAPAMRLAGYTVVRRSVGKGSASRRVWELQCRLEDLLQ